MKKSSIAIAVVAALAVGYPASAWFTGQRLEAKLNKAEKKDPLLSNFKVVKQTYTRGIFSSTQEQTYELNLAGAMPGVPLPGMAGSFQEGAEAEAETPVMTPEQMNELNKLSKPIQIRVINHIKHGPVPGIFGIAAGKVDTELVLDPEVLAEIKKVFGEKKFLEITTILNYSGGGTLKLSSPAFTTTTTGMSQTKIDWKGVKMEVGFDEDYNKLSVEMTAPGLDGADTNGAANFKMGEIKLKGDAQRVIPGGMIFVGKTKANIAAIDFSTKAGEGFNVKDVTLESDSTHKNDLLEMGLKFGVANIKVKDVELNNFHYDYSVKNIHAPTLNKLAIEFSAVSKSGDPSAQLMAFQGIWQKYAMEFLKYDPSIALDRLSISGKGGEFKTSAKVKLPGVTEADFGNMNILMNKVEADMDVSLADPLIEEVINLTQKDPNARSMMLSGAKASIGAMEGQGYILRKDKTLSSQIVWKNGKLTINGKPYPAMPAAAPVMPADEVPPPVPE